MRQNQIRIYFESTENKSGGTLINLWNVLMIVNKSCYIRYNGRNAKDEIKWAYSATMIWYDLKCYDMIYDMT